MSIVYKCEQGTMQWYRLRLGIPTASMFHKIVTPATGKISEQRHDYMNRLIAERLLMESMDTPLSVEWVEHGREEQPNAIANFRFLTEVELEPVGFITTNDGRYGCSPDMLLKSRNEAVEIKCPAPFTQIGYLRNGVGPNYRPQVQGQLLVGEFDRVHFYAYHCRMPAVHITIHPDPQYQKLLKDGLEQFCDELEKETLRCRKMGTYLPNMGFTTPHEEAAPGPDPLTQIVP